MGRTMKTSITKVDPQAITVRGFNLADTLIGRTSVGEYFHILLTGARPTRTQARLIEACIVTIAEHGLVPSVQVARMTYASSPESLHGAVAAGLLGCGSVILGSSEESARLLAEIVRGARDGRPLAEVAGERVSELRRSGQPVPGVGHPVHREVDPRAAALLKLAAEQGTIGQHCQALEAVVAAIPAIYGRSFALNASGVIPAVLLDAGFPIAAMKGIPLIGRTMSLVAHLLEEEAAPIGFALAAVAEEAVDFVPSSTTAASAGTSCSESTPESFPR